MLLAVVTLRPLKPYYRWINPWHTFLQAMPTMGTRRFIQPLLSEIQKWWKRFYSGPQIVGRWWIIKSKTFFTLLRIWREIRRWWTISFKCLGQPVLWVGKTRTATRLSMCSLQKGNYVSFKGNISHHSPNSIEIICMFATRKAWHHWKCNIRLGIFPRRSIFKSFLKYFPPFFW